MYDVIVIGQGLSGLLSAIWAKEQGLKTALVASGTGKILQSTGVVDLIPGQVGTFKDWMEQYASPTVSKGQVQQAVEKFKKLTNQLNYPYKGHFENPVSIITGSGHLKQTALYPYTINPMPNKGHVVIVGFEEVVDFQPTFIKGILQKERPELKINTLTIKLGKHSLRTMTQLDAARLLDQEDMLHHCIQQIQNQFTIQKITHPDILVFPASLGVTHWKETLEYFSTELDATITEAPGMPPNATAARLHERLKTEATKMGVRFHVDTTVVGSRIIDNEIQAIQLKTNQQHLMELSGKHFVLATGGVLGGGLEMTRQGMKETALRLEVNESGEFLQQPDNLITIGASNGLSYTHYGITGAMSTIVNSHEAIRKIQQKVHILGGVGSA